MLGIVGAGLLVRGLVRLAAGVAWLVVVAVWRTLALLGAGLAVMVDTAADVLEEHRPPLRRARASPPEAPEQLPPEHPAERSPRWQRAQDSFYRWRATHPD